MFLGHFAAGFGAKKLNTSPSLGTFFLAAQFIDLMWPLFLLLGFEQVEIDPGNTAFTPLNFIYYPFTHGLISVLIWGVLFGLIYYFIRKDIKASLLLATLVISHWFLDLIVHRADLPLTPWNDTRAGLGLWNSVPLSILIELLFLTAGVFLYLKAVKKNYKPVVLWSLVVFLLVIFILNITSPPPPSSEAIGYAGLSMWLLVAWGYWADKPKSEKK